MERCGNCLDVIFDEFYYRQSAIIRLILDSKYKFDEKIHYSYGDSSKTPGLKVAHCFANIFLRFKETKLKLIPYIKNSVKDHKMEIENGSEELRKFSKMIE